MAGGVCESRSRSSSRNQRGRSDSDHRCSESSRAHLHLLLAVGRDGPWPPVRTRPCNVSESKGNPSRLITRGLLCGSTRPRGIVELARPPDSDAEVELHVTFVNV